MLKSEPTREASLIRSRPYIGKVGCYKIELEIFISTYR